MSSNFRRFGIAVAIFIVVGHVDVVAQPKRVALRAAHMIDPQQEKRIDDVVVVIEGDRIKAVGTDLAVPDGAEVIDLGRATLLPGLIDVHVHITSQSGDYYADRFRRSPLDEAVTAHVYARRTLEAGFTSVRNVGSSEFVDVALRNAINKGLVVGPRIQAATLAISATGGHG